MTSENVNTYFNTTTGKVEYVEQIECSTPPPPPPLPLSKSKLKKIQKSEKKNKMYSGRPGWRKSRGGVQKKNHLRSKNELLPQINKLKRRIRIDHKPPTVIKKNEIESKKSDEN